MAPKNDYEWGVWHFNNYMARKGFLALKSNNYGSHLTILCMVELCMILNYA